jgi:hypothetical protein
MQAALAGFSAFWDFGRGHRVHDGPERFVHGGSILEDSRDIGLQAHVHTSVRRPVVLKSRERFNQLPLLRAARFAYSSGHRDARATAADEFELSQVELVWNIVFHFLL